MNKTCIKCNKNFTNVYLLDKHLNRKIPCNVEIKCLVCEKIFKYDRELTNHLNKKKPCVKHISKISDKLLIINAKKQASLDILNLQKIKAERKQQDLMASYKARENLYLLRREMMETDNIHKNLRKITSIRTAQENKDKIAELLKIEREYNIKKTLKALSINLPILKNTFDGAYVLKNFHEICIEHRFKEHCIGIFSENIPIVEIILKNIKNTLNNDKYPEYRTIYYIPKENIFCAMVYDIDSNEKIIITMDYKQVYEVLIPLIKHILNVYTGKTMHLQDFQYDNQNNKDIVNKFEYNLSIYDTFVKHNTDIYKSIESTKNTKELVLAYKKSSYPPFLEQMQNGIHGVISHYTT
jgi:hypothetical protein